MALSPFALGCWQKEIVLVGSDLLNKMPDSGSVDLMSNYARPLCERVAGSVTGIAASNLRRATQLASWISAAAAEPFDWYLGWRAKRADKQLTNYFHSGPDALRVAGFVAIAQTLPWLLGRIWLSLIHQPAEWSRLSCEPHLAAHAVDELLRHSGLTQNLFRAVAADCEVNGTNVHRGERVMLRIGCANRDPERFNMPESIDVLANRDPHLALGLGKHSCVAAPLIRMIVGSSTHLLTQRLPSLRLAGDVKWYGGSGFRSPISLPVHCEQNGIAR